MDLPTMNRRTALKRLLGASAAFAAVPLQFPPLRATGNDSPTEPEQAAMAEIGREFMERFQAPALAVSIMQNGRPLVDLPLGMANRREHEPCTKESLFRIASVTKPITSVAIFTLVEQGNIKLSDKVFGPNGILESDYGKPPYKRYVTDITVDHLLTHTSGGWQNDDTDPMFHNNSWDHTQLISWTVANLALSYPPGEHWAYSNFGYCVLGRVIEKVTKLSYQDYVRQAVLAPCGITQMRIAGNTLQERAVKEVVYLGQDGENPYAMNVARMDSHGGWIASASDLARFAGRLGGTPPSLLKPGSIESMTTPTPAYSESSPAKYARGWMVRENGKGNWWHVGSLPGTTSIMVRTPSGMCWGALTNTRSQPSETIDLALDNMVWDMVHQVPHWIT